MNRSLVFLACICLLSSSLVFAEESQKHSVKPKEGFVPDAKTAMRIAEAIWVPIYGKENIEKQKPFTAREENSVWIVEGSLPQGMLGGVALAEISKLDGRIIRVS